MLPCICSPRNIFTTCCLFPIYFWLLACHSGPRKIFAAHWPLTSAKQILSGKNTEGVLKTSIFLVCLRSVFQIFDSLGPGGRLRNLSELFWTFLSWVKVSLINLFHPPSTRENITRPERSNFNIARSSSMAILGSWAFWEGPSAYIFGLVFFFAGVLFGLLASIVCVFGPSFFHLISVKHCMPDSEGQK